MNLRQRLARLERRLAMPARAAPAGFVMIYEPGGPVPEMTPAQRRSVAQGAAVFWIPSNGREQPA